MATSGALGGFLNAMLSLRSQRMQEQLAQDEAFSKGLSALTSGISSAAGSLSQGATGMYNNQLANTAMNSTIPRAQAVDPSMQGPADAAAAGMPDFYTGGTAELGIRKAMGQFKGSQGMSAAEAMRLGISMKNSNLAEERLSDARANTAFNNMTEEGNAIYKDSLAYMESAPKLLEKIAKAPDRNTYNALANQLRSLNEMNIGRGLSTPPVPVPPYLSQEDRDAMTALTEAQKNIQGVSEPYFGQSQERKDLMAAQEGAQGRTSSIADMPVGDFPESSGGNIPGAIPLPKSAQRQPDGATATGPGGKRYKKMGKFLVPIQ